MIRKPRHVLTRESRLTTRSTRRRTIHRQPMNVEALEERKLLAPVAGYQSEDDMIDQRIKLAGKLEKLQPLGDAGEGASKVLAEAGQEARESLPIVGKILKGCRKIGELIDWIFESPTPPQANLAAQLAGPAIEPPYTPLGSALWAKHSEDTPGLQAQVTAFDQFGEPMAPQPGFAWAKHSEDTPGLQAQITGTRPFEFLDDLTISALEFNLARRMKHSEDTPGLEVNFPPSNEDFSRAIATDGPMPQASPVWAKHSEDMFQLPANVTPTVEPVDNRAIEFTPRGQDAGPFDIILQDDRPPTLQRLTVDPNDENYVVDVLK